MIFLRKLKKKRKFNILGSHSSTIPIRRNSVPSASRSSSCSPASKIRAASGSAPPASAGAGADAEIRGLELERDGRAGEVLAFRRAETFSVSARA